MFPAAGDGVRSKAHTPVDMAGVFFCVNVSMLIRVCLEGDLDFRRSDLLIGAEMENQADRPSVQGVRCLSQ
ncbi:hypothetical protein JOE21_003485 [Desmospora profundinema]|uniref:Uncharacterized protein n=1 Tax=Desmospora profundinema TaxID=1571184 RepID=A0ABU1IUP2_9BACL|nr:hypothetical protein [Desmospora profundinema]